MYLENKVICFLGDSITEGIGVFDKKTLHRQRSAF